MGNYNPPKTNRNRKIYELQAQRDEKGNRVHTIKSIAEHYGINISRVYQIIHKEEDRLRGVDPNFGRTDGVDTDK